MWKLTNFPQRWFRTTFGSFSPRYISLLPSSTQRRHVLPHYLCCLLWRNIAYFAQWHSVMACSHRRRGRDKTHRNWVKTRQNCVLSARWTSHYVTKPDQKFCVAGDVVDDVIIEVPVTWLDHVEVLFGRTASTVDVRHPAAAAAPTVHEMTQVTVFTEHLAKQPLRDSSIS